MKTILYHMTITVIAFSCLIHAGLDRSAAIYIPAYANDSLAFPDIISLRHGLDVAGIPYTETNTLAAAIKNSVIYCPVKLTDSIVTQSMADSLTDYVSSGGILVGFWVRAKALASLFGIQSTTFSEQRYRLIWQMQTADPSLCWIDDPNETTIRLGDSSRTEVISTVSYQPAAGATILAEYDDASAGVLTHTVKLGHTYAIGLGLRSCIVYNQLDWDYSAGLASSNVFEPTSDVVMLFLRGIYQKHIPYAVWKHTCPFPGAALMLTHDVDSRSSFDTMQAFAQIETDAGIRGHYFITTHYYDDPPRIGAIYNDASIRQCAALLAAGHEIGSHTVAHIPDFFESYIPAGSAGNTPENYKPLCPYDTTTGASVYGEMEVSKFLLEKDFDIRILSFRTGYLLYHPAMPTCLSDLHYSFCSSRASGAVLTNFPYYMQENVTSYGKLLPVLEIPMTISDVVSDGSYDSSNVEQIFDIWTDIIVRNTANGAPTVLLIHPNRMLKVSAEKKLIDQLQPDVFPMGFDDFGEFWNQRNALRFSSELSGNGQLLIRLNTTFDSIPLICLAADSIPDSVEVLDKNSIGIPVTKTVWRDFTMLSVHGGLAVRQNPKASAYKSSMTINAGRIVFSTHLARPQQVIFRIYNLKGALVHEQILQAGSGALNLISPKLPSGMFIGDIQIGEKQLRNIARNY